MKSNVRFANIHDVENICNFIDTYWRKDHILARNRDFFRYEYQKGSDINFVISEDSATKSINAILGFIQYGGEFPDVMNALWKSINKEDPACGIKLLNEVLKSDNFHSVSSIGLNKRTLGIYKFLGLTVDKLKQYYMINTEIEKKLCVLPDGFENLHMFHTDCQLVKCNTMSELLEHLSGEIYIGTGFPNKNATYIEKRYFNHPIYSYNVYWINGGSRKSFIVLREEKYQTAKALRIIDFIGDMNDAKHIGEPIKEILYRSGCEYVDFYISGDCESILNLAGFTLNKNKEIIPNYYSPFVKENIEIYYFTNSSELKYFVKGDGDQDRPS